MFSVGLKTLAPLLILTILTSKLGISFYGQYAVILSLFFIFVLIGDLGLSMEMPKRISKNRLNLEEVSKYATLYLLTKIAISLVLMFILFFLLETSLILKIIILLCLILKNIDPEVLFMGLEEYGFIAKISFISKILHIVLLLIMDFSNNGIEKVFLVQLLIFFTTNVLFYYYLFYKIKLRFKFMPTNTALEIMRSSLEFYFARFFPNLYMQGSTYALSYYIPIDLIAIYAIALDFYKLGHTVIGSIGRVLYSNLMLTRNFELLKKITVICLLAQFCLVPVIYFIGGHVLYTLFDFDIELLYQLSLLFYVSLVFVIINCFWGYPVFSAIGKDRIGHICVISMAVTYFTLLFLLILINDLTIYSAVLCIIAADFVGTVMRLIFAINNRILP